ncbi:molybdenum cofactor biosynthesis protein A [Burkholderia pseudomallei]|uniref:radical SAM protein n=1 Tax=Burkholderia pseudomallei TaxID=28450 RepID=UPI000F06C702|nr:radical SAM protein [Burkholderia pseudomallei]VBT75840.1 molybdenum cofactor biosynthesis protein A [Burkholderia pseudomallei]
MDGGRKKFVKWYFTKNCDLGCAFCHNAYNRKTWGVDSEKDIAVSVAENLRNSKLVAGLTFLGGEPTYSESFIPACNALRGADFKFGIVTAGHKLSDLQLSGLYHNPNLGFIGVSLDSLDSQIVKDIRGRDVFDHQYGGLLNATNTRTRINAKYQIYVNIILTSKNALSMNSILDHMHEIGVNKVKILSYNTRDKGSKAASELKLGLTELYEASKSIAQNHDQKKEIWARNGFDVEYNFLSALAKQYFNDVEGHSFPTTGHLCPISRDTVFLANDGRLFACEYFKPYFGIDDDNFLGERHDICNLLDTNFDDAVEKFYFKTTFYTVANSNLYESLYPCNECKHLFKTCVPCGLKGTARSEVTVNEHCNFYKEKLEISGAYQTRENIRTRLREPLVKHKTTTKGVS